MKPPSYKTAALGIDVGTTHCKAGVFGLDGTAIAVASRATPSGRTSDGHPCFDPEVLWSAIGASIREVTASSDLPIEAVGVASMAEAGLLVDGATGEARTEIIPWFDPRSTEQAEAIARVEDPDRSFRRTGLRPSFKYSLSKIMWLRERDPVVTTGAVWLSVADYVVFRLTGEMVTDPTLAARTYAFDLAAGRWDEQWIRGFDLDPSLFPSVRPSGTPVGGMSPEGAAATGLPTGTPVAVAGHDHVCALPAAGILNPGPVLDSIGTAESMLGVLPALDLGDEAYRSGLTIVPHVLPDRWCWLGGTPSAGGSIEWLRCQLGEEPVPYERLDDLAEGTGPQPSGIVFVPYLSGAGAPVHDQRARAGFAGLSASHSRGDLVKAVLEGTTYEIEAIRRAAEILTGVPICELVAVGGGVRNRRWLQIRANVTGCTIRVSAVPDATVLGAALIAALGTRSITPENIGPAVPEELNGEVFEPNPEFRDAYRHMYETAYVPFQNAIRMYGGGTFDLPAAVTYDARGEGMK